VRATWAYVPPALVVWAGTLAAGVHPTIAGVVVGLLTPVRPWPGSEQSPAERVQRTLRRWVAFGIMPLFGLANAGVALAGVTLDEVGGRAFLGVLLGLVLGKPIGVVGFSWLAVRLRLAALPAGVGWSGVVVVGLAAGIGFTMALFIASLAFPEGPLADTAKLGILGASVVAGLVAVAAGRLLLGGAQPR